ncbi:MAG TPA: hypothetical protein VN873_15215 [Candidatus Angelobacter sp.]|nr:hypothetical protein [Candidatus Angelobacter sp.]
MKTNTSNSELKSRPEQLNTAKTRLRRINFARRRVNRSLNTESLLSVLRNRAPRFFELAEVVGKWVWIQFADKQPAEVTRALAEYGFHWNRARQAWQHPCGVYRKVAANYDPRARYGSYFVADSMRA